MNAMTQTLRTMSAERRLYTLRHLPTQCLQANELERVRQLLTSFEFLETKIAALQTEDGVNQLLADYASAIAALADKDRILTSLASAIRLSAAILREDTKQMFPQIYGRLLNESTSSLHTLLEKRQQASPWLRLHSKTMFSPESPLIRTLIGHNDKVLDCALSNDAHIALSASSDHTLRIWNAETGLCEHVLRGHTEAVNSCALSGDGKLALSASTDKTLRLWDVKTGQCLGVFEGHTDKITGCALSEKEAFFVSSSYDQTVRLWDRQRRTSVVLNGHEERVTCCALSADGRFALSGSHDKTLRLWNVATQECLRVIKDERGGITDCALSYDGQLAFSKSIPYLLDWEHRDQTAHLLPLTLFYNPENKSESDLNVGLEGSFIHDLLQIIHHVGMTDEILESDAVVSVWDVSLGTRIRELAGHQGSVSHLDLSKDGKRLLSASQGEIKIWETEAGLHLASLFEGSVGVDSCALDRTGNTVISSSHGGLLHIWSVPLAIKDANVIERAYSVSALVCCRYNQKGDLALSLSVDRKIQLWNAQTGNLIGQIQTTELPVIRSADVNVDRQIAVVAPPPVGLSSKKREELEVFDTRTGKLLQTLVGHRDPITVCTIDQMGKVALSGSTDGILCLWNIENYTCRFVLDGHNGEISCCALSTDGLRAFSGSNDTTLRLWDTQTGQCLHLLQGHSDSVKSCSFSTNGQRGLSVGSDGMLCLWDLSSGILLRRLISPIELSDSCALNAHGRLALYIAPQRTVHLVEIEAEQEIAKFTFDARINSVAFSPQGNDIMVSDISGRVHFLSIEEGVP